MADYITLANSTATLTKRFTAIGMGISWPRRQSRENQSSGALSLVTGRHNLSFSYSLLVPESVSDANYGTMDDLKTFHKLNNPSGSVTDELTLTTNDGTEYQVRFLGEPKLSPKTPFLTGNNAYYAVAIELFDCTVPTIDLSEASNSYLLGVI